MLLALTESWSDLVAITGLLVTVAGFALTLYQLRKTKSAAEAARSAADRAYAESRRYFESLIASNAHNLVTQVRETVQSKDWANASRRVNDLADQMALLPQADAEAAQFVNELRTWGGRFARLASGDLKKFYNSRWDSFLVVVQRRIDTLRTPFVT
jgi:hypothetical protein